jgi:mono/diheme cytochrome c family protein
MFHVLSGGLRALIFGILLTAISLTWSDKTQAQDTGEQAFNTTCFACHTIGGGRLIGPDLAGIHENRSQEWLEQFVKSSQALINSGDADAVAIYEEYNSMIMPDALLSDEQIRAVLDFIKTKSSDQPEPDEASTVAQAEPEEPASEADILAGQEMFQGNIRFENKGAPCNACHDVRGDAVMGGGILAAELTTVFSRMGKAGVQSILGRAPFPVMQAAYVDKELTELEVRQLVAFLEYANSQEYHQLPRDYGLGLFASGVVGAGFLFGLFAFIWRGRKTGSVNQAIYDRQIKTSLDDTA